MSNTPPAPTSPTLPQNLDNVIITRHVRIHGEHIRNVFNTTHNIIERQKFRDRRYICVPGLIRQQKQQCRRGSAKTDNVFEHRLQLSIFGAVHKPFGLRRRMNHEPAENRPSKKGATKATSQQVETAYYQTPRHSKVRDWKAVANNGRDWRSLLQDAKNAQRL